ACAESIACGCYCVNATCCGVTVSGLYKCGNGAVTDCGGNKVIYWDSSCSKWKFNGEATSGGGGGGSCIACGSYNVTASCCGVTICGLYRGGNAITDSCGTSLIYWDSMCSQWKFNGAAACGGGGGCSGYACYADYLGCPCGRTTLYVSGCALYFKNNGCNGYITLVEKNMLSDCSKVLVWCG
ncbi:MAG: hypothetical protein IKO55_07010, partial [Kiritimatiellae bacterium]|nr:hypothetical protein [Kiritimatiellia bacterium]